MSPSGLFYKHSCGVYPLRYHRLANFLHFLQLHDNHFQRPAMHDLLRHHKQFEFEFELELVEQR